MEEVEEQIMDSKVVTFFENHNDKIFEFGTSILAALAILIIGIYTIRFLMKMLDKIMDAKNIDETLQKFGINLLNWILKILLFIAVADRLGVNSTSFSALIAAAGLGVGFALQGSLGNLAGGVIIMLFRPFNIGDFIEVQGVKGYVEDIQIFSTIIRTFQNKTIYVPNGALSNGNISNISQKGHIRLDLTIGVDYSSDIKQTKDVLMKVIKSVDGVLKEPESNVVLTELADSSLNFTMLIWVNIDDYYAVKAAVLEKGKEALDAAGIEIPFPHQVNLSK
jgi:small conductance mechanosensitive channel